MTKAKSGSKEQNGGDSPSRLIDARIKELDDWRGETLAHIRKLIKQADPDVVEEWKWRGVPVWYHAGMICTGETYKNVVKMTFRPSPKAPCWKTRPDFSTPAWTATPGVPPIFMRTTTSTKRP